MVHLVTNVAEYGIIVDEEKKQFLLVQWDEEFDYTWHFAGGRIDEGENEKEGLIREIKEELNVDVNIIKPVYAKYVTEHLPVNAKPRYALFYLCTLKKGQEIKLNTTELNDHKWFTKSDLSKINFWLPFYKEMLEQILPF